MAATGIIPLRDISRNGMLGVPIILVALLAMLVVPLPPFMLDIFFTFNITLSLVVILSGVYSKRPLDFAAFPTVLLLATLLRLALNIASTRIVLLEGHTGTDAAGHVIEAFGDFVIGGNYAVGLVVFAILVIINFVVVTKGAGRISEVSARFTLDSMPGKQMSIDADLNAGVIDSEEAKRRREDVVAEADFYGSMDGASKFVRGDAVAGILILFINIIGGLSIGMVQHDMGFSAAVENYTLLTIGDGLVAQIPSLLLSTATAIMVTRVSSEQNMGQQIVSQLCGNPRALIVTSAVMTMMGIIPGMPNLMFLSLALATGGAAYFIINKNASESEAQEDAIEESSEGETESADRDLSWEDVHSVDTLGMEVGYRLIPLVDKNQGGELMARIKAVRKKQTQELGFLIPPVHIRDNLDLSPSNYKITLLGVTVGEGEIYTEKVLAINPGQVYGKLDGIAATDPAFGMEAWWIDQNSKDNAQSLGYTVVDPSTVIATHLSQIIQTHSHELLGREEVQQLLDNLEKSAPKLVEGFVPEILPLGVVQKVIRNLLEENIPIVDMRSIVETLAVEGTQCQDPDILTEILRVALKRLIVQRISGLDDELSVIALDHDLERLLQDSVKLGDQNGVGLEPGLADRLHTSLLESAQKMEITGSSPVLLVPGVLRKTIAKFIKSSIPDLHVLSYYEIPDNKKIKVVATVGQQQTV